MPKRKTTFTKLSGTTKWFARYTHSSDYSLCILDQTGDGLAKRVVVFLKNSEADDASASRPWREFILTPSSPTPRFDVAGDDYIEVSFGSTVVSSFVAVPGTQYGSSGINSVVAQGVESGSIYSVYNNEDEDMTLRIYRNGCLVSQQTLASEEHQDFQFRYRFWIGIIGLDTAFDPSLFNTEVSLLGVVSADVVIGGVSGNYVFTLANITS